MIPINIIFDNYIFNASQLKDDHDLADFLLIGMTRAEDTQRLLRDRKQ
jgi:hypothetical protein